MKEISLSKQLTFSLLVTILLTAIIVIIASLFISRNITQKELQESSQELLKSISEVLAIPVWNIDQRVIDHIGSLYSQNSLISSITIEDTKKNTLYHTTSDDLKIDTLSAPILYTDNTLDSTMVGTVTITISNRSYQKQMSRLLYNISTLIIAIVVVLFFSTRILLIIFLNKPINAFNEQIRRLAAEDKESETENSLIVTEFKPLVSTLQSMQSVIAQQFNTLKELNTDLENRVMERTAKLEQATEEATIANQAKTQFLANMSHEIRTPMNAILGFTEILKNEVLDKKYLFYIESIHASGRSLLNLINDILDLSKVEAGKLTLEYSAVSLLRLCNEMATIFSHKIQDKGLELIIETPPNLPRGILLDETRLRQILINLIGNALKFTHEGYIKVAITYAYSNPPHKSAVNLEISVSDTGIGIPKDQQQKIFDAFTQTKGQNSSLYGGTGLGLAISQKLTKMMNGFISVTSEIGEGSCFTIHLKNAEITLSTEMYQEELSDPELDTINFQAARIITADDIELNRELVKGFLKKSNVTILEAENGQEVMELLEKESDITCLLLDMKMPVMDGYEVIKALKKDPRFISLPIIAITASALLEEEKSISELCDLYLRKPIRQKELISGMMQFIPYQKPSNDEIVNKPKNLPSPPAHKKFKEVFQNNSFFKNEIVSYQNQCTTLLESMAIDKIIEFSEMICAKATEEEVYEIIEWGEELHSAASLFNMEKVQHLLIDFQKEISNGEG